MNDLYTAFLGEITDQCFPCQVKERNHRERAFLQRRFHPDYREKQNAEIGVEIKKELQIIGETFNEQIPDICKKVVRQIATFYREEMGKDQVNIEYLFNSQKGQKGKWEEVYRWLYNHKFSRWFSDYIWKNWQQQAQNKSDWLGFIDKDDHKGMVVTPLIKNNQIKKNYPLIMKVKIEEKDNYLLLLNRGKSEEDTETKFIVCPSLHFAPKIEPVSNLSYLPQSDAHLEDIKFDAIGKEEYMGILVKEIPNLTWLNPHQQGELPLWNDNQIYELWQALEEQGDYKIYYQRFEVV